VAAVSATVVHGDCLAALRALPDASVDALVTDPPYGLSFMGKAWDRALPDPAVWAECLRVLRPGAHAVVFGAPRLYHRLAVQVEDAGFEIRDCLMWLFGSGFPKSLNLDGERAGWGTALKPAYEPILLARKPLTGTVAANVLEHGVGGLNIDACRIGGGPSPSISRRAAAAKTGKMGRLAGPNANEVGQFATGANREKSLKIYLEHRHGETLGRWPANVCLDETAAALLDEQTGELRARGNLTSKVCPSKHAGATAIMAGTMRIESGNPGDSGGASRFFYTAKSSREEREAGLAHLPMRVQDETRDPDAPGANNPRNRGATGRANHHPTVKPLALMRWLCRLITPPGGLVLDPFTGSGSTGCAAVAEGFRFLGCEREAEYVEIARARIAHWQAQRAEEQRQLGLFAEGACE
jgi:DNA modification methylase